MKMCYWTVKGVSNPCPLRCTKTLPRDRRRQHTTQDTPQTHPHRNLHPPETLISPSYHRDLHPPTPPSIISASMHPLIYTSPHPHASPVPTPILISDSLPGISKEECHFRHPRTILHTHTTSSPVTSRCGYRRGVI